MNNYDFELFRKYDQAVPRYTSYPAVPNWNDDFPSSKRWLAQLEKNLGEDPNTSIYIHLPFCEQLCTYCACNKRITKNHQVEEPYIESLLAEWKYYLDHLDKRPVIREIHLGGGTPTFFSDHQLERLLETILSSVEVAENLNLSFEAHPNSTSPAHLKTLRDVGFNRISIGVQDVSAQILRVINRTQDKNQIRFVTQYARKLGYESVNYDIIYGLPFQEEKHIHDTIAFIEQQKPDRIAFYSYAHVPWKSKVQRAFTIDNIAKGEQKLRLKILGQTLLEQIGYKMVGMDHFVLPHDSLYQACQKGEMHRNFMGYTELYTRCLIGLGASAISDCGDMYVQNEKGVEDYQDNVANNGLTFIKGHLLSAEEKSTRKLINSIMCNGKTSWSTGSLEADIINKRISFLKDIYTDRLIELSLNQIEVTEEGRGFVRNICACLDPQFEIVENRYSNAL